MITKAVLEVSLSAKYWHFLDFPPFLHLQRTTCFEFVYLYPPSKNLAFFCELADGRMFGRVDCKMLIFKALNTRPMSVCIIERTALSASALSNSF